MLVVPKDLELGYGEIFIPLDPEGKTGRIIATCPLPDDLQRISIGDAQYFTNFGRNGAHLLSLEEEVQAFLYAREHKGEDPRLAVYYASLSDLRNVRLTRTLVCDLHTPSPYLMNVLDNTAPVVHVPVSFLPSESGYIQKLDEKTGLPSEISDAPNPDLDGAYFYLDHSGSHDSIPVWLYGIPGVNIHLGSTHSFTNVRYVVNYGRDFPPDLERRL